MEQKRNPRVRRREVVTGLVVILTSFIYVGSILFDFSFVSSYATLQEDLVYLSEQIDNQKISSIAWLATSLATLVSIPFYLLVFHGRLQTLQYLTGLLLLGASLGFLLMGKTGLDIHRIMLQIPVDSFQEAGEEIKLSLLEKYRQEQMFRKIGSSFVGLFAMGLSIVRFRLGRFPFLSAGLLLVSGPLLIFYNWYDPDHLIRTAAMAGIMIGVVMFSVRLINKGLSDPVPD
ncbi:MAG TPA: hypothetical protein ENO20_09955 [Bacteroides sp.]|nr:hypothetical protein [Bacteroides sp.]